MVNKLCLNFVETEYPLIGSKLNVDTLSSEPNIVIGSNRTKTVRETKLLGIQIDQFL